MIQDSSSSNVAKPKLAYTLEEAAAACGYSIDTIRRALRKSEMVASYANSKPVILLDELVAWLQALPTEAPTSRVKRKARE